MYLGNYSTSVHKEIFVLLHDCIISHLWMYRSITASLKLLGYECIWSLLHKDSLCIYYIYIILTLGLGQHSIIKYIIICSAKVWIFMLGRINSKVSIVFFWYSNKLMDETVWYRLNTWDSLILRKILNKTSNQIEEVFTYAYV